ncbi:MAG TPA: AI-2E family transporter [Dermatophilaceae bacterium]|nr:AI-2E family transporter [Dermatophilaceae bacterium]
MLRRWREFRRRQLEALRLSNHPDADTQDEPPPAEPPAQAPAQTAPETLGAYGPIGRPLNRHSPFYVGFIGALGVLSAVGLAKILGELSQVITLLVVAFFLALALDPVVAWVTRRGVVRAWSVTAVFAGLVLVFALLGAIVVPPVAAQAGQLAQNAPDYVAHLLDNPLVKDLDRNYQITERLQEELRRRAADGSFLGSVFGGVLGAGMAVVSGLFSTLTVLILTLYVLATLPSIKHAAYAIVPASRRPRVVSLSEEVMRRVGSYAIGQVAVATTNAICSYVMMTILAIPYAAVLAVVVGALGLIPMVGATLGAAIVASVALFDEPRKAIIAIAYYVLYQQIENYVIAPRIMQRTVSVPGAVTVVAALAGGALLGVLGALLAIPVAAGLLLLYEEVLVPRQRKV